MNVLEVGNLVGFVRYGSNGHIFNYGFGTVEKINGHGHIYVATENGQKKFDRRGNSYKDNYGPVLVTDVFGLQKRIAKLAADKEISSVVRKIERTIKQQYTGGGSFVSNLTVVETLKELISELEVLTLKSKEVEMA